MLPPDGPDRARHLHDSALQRLFAAGLVLQSTLAGIADPAVRERVRHSVAVLDEVIDEIRGVLAEDRTVAAGTVTGTGDSEGT